MAVSTMGTAVKATKSNTPITPSVGGKPSRRSQRVTLRVSVLAYTDGRHGHSVRNFKENTFVVKVSAHGGLLELDGDLPRGERFMLKHLAQNIEAEARVVSVTKSPAGKKYLGFEFTDSTLDFWRISFPKPGARPVL